MSEGQRATEIVHSVLHSMQELGKPLRVSNDVLARLNQTAGAVPANKAGKPVPAVASEPGGREGREDREGRGSSLPSNPATGRSLGDLASHLAERLSQQDSSAAPAAPARASTPGSAGPFQKLGGASEIAPASGTKAERLAAMRAKVLACTQCAPLVKARTQVVFGVGNPEAKLMFVGEAPGADEDLVGEPFVGRAGQLLTKIIETMGLKRSDVYIANILKCRPDMPAGAPGNRKPEPEEMRVCKPYVLEQINIIQPRVLVALGATAVEGLLGIEKAGITRMRGQWKDFGGIPLMPTFHPSFLLRPSADQQANKRLVWEDMLAVMDKLEMPISEKQRGFFLPKA